ncbi:hypothetical protein MMC29_002392 [Sticta canariensis]|nr:hypothetical protein [Sticta canariensis]
MSLNPNLWVSVLQVLFILIVATSLVQACTAAAKIVWRKRARPAGVDFPRTPNIDVLEAKSVALGLSQLGSNQNNVIEKEMQLHKDLYYMLQNLEHHPEVLPQSRDLLISLFSETLTSACKEPDLGILRVKHYTPENLAAFLQREQDETMQKWEQYMARRWAGCPTEMFQDREEAKWWLRQIAPVKYVDGAWLGHINKITTPFALRRITKDAWQVLSEELGDGDLSKNHVHVYRELMKEIESELPEGDTPDFIHPRHKMDEPQVWKAAIVQLLISLFPHEFLPETLGFNLHYEGITLETLKAAKELEELKLNAYYFVLHISIDNADSGHTAIAMHTVTEYISHIEATHGNAAAQDAWKRVQAGYILSEHLPTTPDCPSMKTSAIHRFPSSESERDVIQVFRAKAPVAHKIHCSSRLKIGRRTLVDWLKPEDFVSQRWQRDFLHDLSNTRTWVRKGDGHRSKLVQEISWPGKMFGSFTQTEVEIVKKWIDSLANPDVQSYWTFVGRTKVPADRVCQYRDIRADYPVFSPIPSEDFPSLPSISASLLPFPILGSTITTAAGPNLSKMLPLWFTHPCLLESFVCIPARTATDTGSSVTRLLRAQYGFDAEGPGVAGMDEARRPKAFGLVEIGLEMVTRSELSAPSSLRDVLQTWPSKFALLMLHLSMRPIENRGLLIGLACAFVGLQDAIASSTHLLSSGSREALEQMVRRERESLEFCLEELRHHDKQRYHEACRGFCLGRTEIENSFDQIDLHLKGFEVGIQ